MALSVRKEPCNLLSSISYRRRSVEALFLVGWGIWIVIRIMQETPLLSSGLPFEYRPFLALSLLCIFGYEILYAHIYGFKDVLRFAMLGALLISAQFCDEKTLFYTILFAYIGRTVPFKKTAIVTMAVLGIMLFGIMAFADLGILPENIIDEGDVRERSSLGFVWPSRAPNLFLSISMLYVFIRNKRLRPIEMLIILGIAFLMYWETDSRNPLLCSFVLIGFYCFLKWKEGRSRTASGGFLRLAIAISFSAIAAVMILLAFFYTPDSQFMVKMDSLTSGRLLYSHNAFQTTDPTLFGTSIFNSVDGTNDPLGVGFLDSGYLRLLMIFGIVPFIIVMYLLTRLSIKAYDERNWALVACLMCIAVHGFMEGQITTLFYTPFYFLCFVDYGETQSGICAHWQIAKKRNVAVHSL